MTDFSNLTHSNFLNNITIILRIADQMLLVILKHFGLYLVIYFLVVLESTISLIVGLFEVLGSLADFGRRIFDQEQEFLSYIYQLVGYICEFCETLLHKTDHTITNLNHPITSQKVFLWFRVHKRYRSLFVLQSPIRSFR
jgi:hypothetical protein